MESKLESKIFKLLLAILLIYLILGEALLPEKNHKEIPDCKVLDIDWNWIKEDGTMVPVSIPGSYDVPPGEPMIITATLPDDIEENTYLRFYSMRQDMTVSIDGVQRAEYSTQDTRPFGTTSSAYYLFVKMNSRDAGKNITVSLTNTVSYSGVLRAVYYGEKLALWGQSMRKNLPELFAALITILLSLICIIVCMVLRLCYHQDIELEYLGWGVFIAAMWIFCNTEFRQLIFPNISVASDVTFMCIMIAPLPIMIYIDKTQNHRYNKAIKFINGLLILDCIVCCCLHAAGLVDFSRSITVIMLICGSSFLFLIITMILDVCNGEIRNYILEAIGMLGAISATFAQFALYSLKRSIPFTSAIMSMGLIFLLIVSAISTFREMLRIQRERQQAILESESKAQFLASMSHEIRTPINAVLGMDEMILRESNQQEILEYATDIQNAGKSLLSLINDILDFSKIESGKLELLPVEYNLSDLIYGCYQMMSKQATDKGLQILVKNDPNIPRSYLGDEARIRQVLINLLSNAVKYTPEGEIEIIVNGSYLSEDTFELCLLVQDTGIGISPQNLEHLFDAFRRLDEVKNRHIEGTGLGLTVTRQLVTLMDGTIEVRSEYGQGSIFIIKIPQQIQDSTPVGDIQVHQKKYQTIQQEQTLMKNAQGEILMVDDIPVNQKVFVNLLKGTGLDVDTADSGVQCLERIKEKKYDIIFLDHMMPDMDGVETFQQMKKDTNHKNTDTPVIMLTANAIAGARQEYLDMGFQDYLSKPIQGHDLERMIQKYL